MDLSKCPLEKTTETKNGQVLRLVRVSQDQSLEADLDLAARSFRWAFKDASPEEALEYFGGKDVGLYYKDLMQVDDVEPFLAHNLIWIRAFLGQELVGMLGFQSEANSPHLVYMTTLLVSPDCPGCGIGKALVDSLSHWWPTTQEVILQVCKINHTAIGFYKHIGFVFDATLDEQSPAPRCHWMRWVKAV